MAELLQSPNYVVKVEDSTLNILKEIEVYTLLSHYYWGLWSLVSSLTDLTKTIEFDYWVTNQSLPFGIIIDTAKQI